MAVAVAALTVLAILGGCLLWSVERTFDQAPPDVRAFARAPSTRTADRRAADEARSQLSAFRKDTPWATYVGTSTFDVCLSQRKHTFTLLNSRWLPASCQRFETLYLTFHGGLAQHLAQLDTATLQQLRWRAEPVGDAVSAKSFVAQLACQRMPLPPAGWPLGAFRTYAPPGGSASAATPTLEVSVVQKPLQPETSYWDRYAEAFGTSRRPYDDDPTIRADYLTFQPLTPTAVAATAYKPDVFVLTLTVSGTYAVQEGSAAATSASAAPPEISC